MEGGEGGEGGEEEEGVVYLWSGMRCCLTALVIPIMFPIAPPITPVTISYTQRMKVNQISKEIE